MKKIGLILLLLTCLINSIFAKKSEISFKRLTIEQGLSQNTSVCILQDYMGYIWIGTDDGLNRYDGYHFKTYYNDPNDPTSLSHNRVKSLYQDPHGILWIGTMGGGLNRFDRSGKKFIHYRSDPQNPNSLKDDTILTIYEDSSRNMWVGTYAGFSKFNPIENNFSHYQPVIDEKNADDTFFCNRVSSIFQDSQGQFWIGTFDGFYRFNFKSNEFIRYHVPSINMKSYKLYNSITSICEDNSGLLWIGTFGGICLFNPLTKNFKSLKENSILLDDPFHHHISSIVKDFEGYIWIGTFNGLIKYDSDKKSYKYYQRQPDNHQSLIGNLILSIYEDQSRVIWIGTYSGICRCDNKRKKFKHFQITGTGDENRNKIFSILEDPSGDLWIGTLNNGLNKYNREKCTILNYSYNPTDPHSLSQNTVPSLLKSRSGELWVGTGNGLNLLSSSTGKFIRYLPDFNDLHSISNGVINVIYEDMKNRIWVGTRNGLNRLIREDNRFIVYKNQPENPNSLSHNYINSILEDSDGVFWIGTYGGGLTMFNPESHQFSWFLHQKNNSLSLSNNKIYPIYDDQKGNIWIGTYGGGLNCLNKDTGICIHYTKKDGLPNNVVLGILEDSKGFLWISTNGGISKFDPKTRIFRNYVLEDGLQSYEYFQNSCYKSSSGEMFFGGVNGFNAFFPAKVKENSHIPAIVVTSISKLNKEVNLNQDLLENGELKLSYKDYFFSLKFAALDFTAPERNQYAYKIKGFEDEWIYLGNKNELTLSHLPPGNYVFRIKGSNSDGVWNERGTKLKIVIAPPFWKTLWFKLGLVIIMLGLLVLIIKNRTRNLSQKMEKEQLKRELQLKADFTAMLVHDLRSPLTAVIGYSEMLSETPDQLNIPKAGKVISQSSEKMLTLINDMLDLSKFEAGKMTLNKKYITMTKILKDNIEMFRPLIERKEIQLVWDQETGTKREKWLIDPEKIGQVVNNLLSNAIKFVPNKGNINIKLSKLEGKIQMRELSIADDGPGVPLETQKYLFDKYAQLKTNLAIKGTGLGLAVSKMIIESHGGMIGFRPRENGKGSIFFFRIPLPANPS